MLATGIMQNVILVKFAYFSGGNDDRISVHSATRELMSGVRAGDGMAAVLALKVSRRSSMVTAAKHAT